MDRLKPLVTCLLLAALVLIGLDHHFQENALYFVSNAMHSNCPGTTYIRHRIMNSNVLDSDEDQKELFLHLVDEKAPASDAELIQIAEKLMNSPSQGIYKPSNPNEKIWTVAQRMAWKLLHKKVMIHIRI